MITILALLLCDTNAARATVLVPLTLSQLTNRSELVVHGLVTRIESRWAPSKRRIITEVRLSILPGGLLKGAKRVGSKVTFYRLGGKVGNLEMRVIGAPRFRNKEEVVVFLSRRRNKLFVTGMVQGKLSVRRDPVSGVKLVSQVLSSVRFSGGMKPVSRVRTLSSLKTLVLDMIKRAKRSN